jgi:hypothetical protein
MEPPPKPGRISRTASAPAGTWPAKAPRCCAGRCTRRPCAPPARALPTTPTTCRSTAPRRQAGGAVGGPQAGPRGLPHPARTRRPGAGPRRAGHHRLNGRPSCAPGCLDRCCGAAGSLMLLPPRWSWTAPIERAAAPAPCGNPITHHVAGPGPSTEIRLDTRATLPAVPPGHARWGDAAAVTQAPSSLLQPAAPPAGVKVITPPRSTLTRLGLPRPATSEAPATTDWLPLTSNPAHR